MIKIFERSIETYRAHVRLFWGMALIGELPAYAGTVIFLSAMGRSYLPGMEPYAAFAGMGWKIVGAALVLTGLMLSAMFIVAMVYAVEDLGEGKFLTAIEAYRSVPMGMAVAVLLAFVLLALVISIGVIFLIVPGILFAIWFWLSPYAIVVDGAEGLDAFRRSKQLVKGHWWKVLGMLVAYGAIEYVGSFSMVGLKPVFGAYLCGVLLGGWEILITPFQILLMIFLYYDLSHAQELG